MLSCVLQDPDTRSVKRRDETSDPLGVLLTEVNENVIPSEPRREHLQRTIHRDVRIPDLHPRDRLNG